MNIHCWWEWEGEEDHQWRGGRIMNILENNMDIIEKMVAGTSISAAEDGAKN